MDDGEALLRAVLEAPFDDGPRLVYADWLEEHGEAERAAAIREGCRTRIGGLANPRSAPVLPPPVLLAYQDRGFIEAIMIPQAAFLRHAEAMFRSLPIAGVRLTDRAPHRPRDCYAWFLGRGRVAGPFPAAELAKELFFLLPPGLTRRDTNRRQAYNLFALYDSEDAARQALSRACVAYGRKLAGLPPLPDGR